MNDAGLVRDSFQRSWIPFWWRGWNTLYAWMKCVTIYYYKFPVVTTGSMLEEANLANLSSPSDGDVIR